MYEVPRIAKFIESENTSVDARVWGEVGRGNGELIFKRDGVSLCSVFSRSARSDSVTSWAAAHQAPLSPGFSRQEHWSRLPYPPPGDLLNPGIEPKSPTLQADSLSSEPPGKPQSFS